LTLVSPTVIVISGRPGAGKTTLAHAVARAVGCPAICRDEIREGIVRAGTPDDGMRHTFETFWATLRLLTEAGVTVVAEAAFQDRLWRPHLPALPAEVRIVRCEVDAAVARERIRGRLGDPGRGAHDDRGHLERPVTAWEPIALDVPTLVVDTTDGYSPGLDAIVAFAVAERGTK
jgi:predicted kinase